MSILQDFLTLDRKALAQALYGGHAVDTESLAGWLYRGVSLGLPSWVDRLAWKTFAKTFYRDPESGVLRGWNLRLEQTGLEGAIQPLKQNGVDFHFGHFQVRPLSEYTLPWPIREGCMLDYGLGGNARFDPVGSLRDPLVSIDSRRSDLLLGWSYVELGFRRIATPSYFVLERAEPLKNIFAPSNPPVLPKGVQI